MTLPREKATHQADLPHEFEGEISLGCEVCGLPLFEPRHVAWEKAQEQHGESLTLPRETGV